MTETERECRNSWAYAEERRVEAASSKLPGFPARLRGDASKSYVISTPGMPSWARDVFISGYTAVTTKYVVEPGDPVYVDDTVTGREK